MKEEHQTWFFKKINIITSFLFSLLKYEDIESANYNNVKTDVVAFVCAAYSRGRGRRIK